MIVNFECSGYGWVGHCVKRGRGPDLFVRVPPEVVETMGLVPGMLCRNRLVPRSEDKAFYDFVKAYRASMKLGDSEASAASEASEPSS